MTVMNLRMDFMKNAKADDPEYWRRETERVQNDLDWLQEKGQSLNQTKGVHTLQMMYGCELQTNGYVRYGYDGEDFIVLNVTTGKWNLISNKAKSLRKAWDDDGERAKHLKDFLENDCIDRLKEFVSYDNDALYREVRPNVSAFQKHSSSPEVVCHATGFFPELLSITWQKDGANVHEDIPEVRATLPNEDGSFQKRSILKVPAEELQKHKYTCVVQHSSLEKELVREEPKVPNEVTHSLQYIYTAVKPAINFPEFTIVGQVDGLQFNYYDSKIRSMIPKTEWILKVDAEDPDYWNRNTQTALVSREVFKVNVDIAMQRFNHSRGVHTVQMMYGCELDDDGTTRGYTQYGYDGEDFIAFDLKTLTWIAPTLQALITKNKWDSDTGFNTHLENYLGNTCIQWLKKYLSYGRETLERKVRPEVSVFQKRSSSPEVVCHATGFFPKAVVITWQKDGEDVHEDVVEIRETLPNQDGSFQKRIILKVPAEELQKHKYTCVVQHSSLRKKLVLEVPKDPKELETQRVKTDLQ